MIVDKGIAAIISDMTDLVETGVVSTDSTTPDAGDTTVPDEISATITNLTDITATNKTLTFKYFINSLIGNGNTFRKCVIKTPTILFSEDLHPDLEKTSSDQVSYFHKITVDRA
jgi:hypothetical protein